MNTSSFSESVADKITKLGLTAPAIWILETHKPLAFIGSQMLLVAQPALDMFLPGNSSGQVAKLLADPDQVEQLIVRLELNSAPTVKRQTPKIFRQDG